LALIEACRLVLGSIPSELFVTTILQLLLANIKGHGSRDEKKRQKEKGKN
jgi:hypothetical protein